MKKTPLILSMVIALLALLAASSSAFAPHTPVTSRKAAATTSGMRSNLVMKDFPKPNLEDTENYRNYEKLSQETRRISTLSIS